MTPPSLSENQKKKLRSEVAATFSEVTAGIKLAIVPENFPETRLDPQQGDLVIQALHDKMIAIDEGAPSFIKVAHKTGAVVVVAYNEDSAEWIKTVAPTFHPWDGAQLRVGPASKIQATH